MIWSHPTMGAWIEINRGYNLDLIIASHPTMGAWIEICASAQTYYDNLKSHPTMGAWIEIKLKPRNIVITVVVAPHDGCVD